MKVQVFAGSDLEDAQDAVMAGDPKIVENAWGFKDVFRWLEEASGYDERFPAADSVHKGNQVVLILIE